MPNDSTQEMTVLYRPDSDDLRFLPEGPYPAAGGRLSWVAIQHGPNAATGSLNLLDPELGENRTIPLPGRPGFAFPTDEAEVYIAGIERSLCLVHLGSGRSLELVGGIDASVEETIINDGVVCDDGLIFGCKDLQFQEAKAGLYHWHAESGRLTLLDSHQVCSNGKALLDDRTLIDIDSPAQTIDRMALVLDEASSVLRIEERTPIVDLRNEDVFPDGLVLSPDRQSVIVAIYKPNPAEFGEVRQYSLATGEREFTWLVPGSPQVTCPQIIRLHNRLVLVVTTAVEHMPAERHSASPHAGSLFVAETDWTGEPDTPHVALPPALAEQAHQLAG